MSRGHAQNMSNEQLVSAIKPLLHHDSWAYFEEYLNREYNKQATVGMKAENPSHIYRAQGYCAAMTNLVNLKQALRGTS